MHDDIERLRQEYAARTRRTNTAGRYSLFNPSHLFTVQQRQRATLDLLRSSGLDDLSGSRILEIGCGNGNILVEYLGYGARAAGLHGVDLLPDRLQEARARIPGATLICADARQLPYEDGFFDLVLQYTAFSSILDETIKKSMAVEMVRVLSKPAGRIVWYDFWTNPLNRQTRGIRLGELRNLFPGWRVDHRRVTLVPQLGRMLARRAWWLAESLCRLRVLNTHHLAVLSREE